MFLFYLLNLNEVHKPYCFLTLKLFLRYLFDSLNKSNISLSILPNTKELVQRRSGMGRMLQRCCGSLGILLRNGIGHPLDRLLMIGYVLSMLSNST